MSDLKSDRKLCLPILGWIIFGIAFASIAAFKGYFLIVLAVAAVTLWGVQHTHNSVIDLSKKRIQTIEDNWVALEDIATKDPLTGLHNRREMDEHLNVQFTGFVANHVPVTIVMADLDYFKVVNDRFGHQVGDQILVEVSEVIKKALRATDHAYRYGGEEFLIALGQVTIKQAIPIIERIRHEIENIQLEVDDTAISVTCSFGVSMFQDWDFSYTEAISRADKALYQSKGNGKNQILIL